MQCVLNVKVMPRSGINKIAKDSSGILKIYLKNPAEKGLANDELVWFLAKTLGIPQHAISIITGGTSRNKRVKIVSTLTIEQVLHKLGLLS